jgi:hypothetical protein
MEPRKKDNFTDAVEAFGRNDTSNPPTPPQSEPKKNDQQVRDNEGNLVTLGQTTQNPTPASNSRKVIELSPQDLETLKEAIDKSLKEALGRFAEKLKNKSVEK